MAQQLTPQAKRVQIARTRLLLDQPFFGVLALHLQPVMLPYERPWQPGDVTAWTDGKVIAYNPAFVDTCDDDELVGLQAHEVMHPASGHCWRRDARNPRKWNRAADLAINPILTDVGFKLPKGALHDDQFVGKSSEWIFDRLPDEDGGGDGQGGDPGGCGEVRDAQGQDGGADPAASEAEWAQNVKQSAQAAKAQGKLPASLARLADELTAPKVDWKSALRRFVQETAAADYTWRRPSKRYAAAGLYLPSLRSEACGRFVVAIDTSGSIDDVTLGQFGAEVSAIASEMQPESVTVVYCDAAVNHVDVFARGELVKLDAHGGGGTAFAPVFEHVDESGDVPACVIYLTDLAGSFPDVPPDYPVVWCTTDAHASAPFGEVIPCGV